MTRAEYRRLIVAAVIGVWLGAVMYVGRPGTLGPRTDLDQILVPAVAWVRQGIDPYATAWAYYEGGPHRWPLMYPATAVVLLLPLTPLTDPMPIAVWTGLGAAGLAWTMTRRGWWGLLAFASGSYFHAFFLGQWSPLAVSGVAVPWAGAVWAGKPTIGAALFAGWPSKRAVLLGVAITAVSLALFPGWPREWVASWSKLPYVSSPVLRPGGFVLLLALLRWRVPEARMLAALALVPHTMVAYETLPLFLIPRRRIEMVLLSIASVAAYILSNRFAPANEVTDLSGAIAGYWPYWLVLMYLPALAMVLMRPNQPDDGALVGSARESTIEAPAVPSGLKDQADPQQER
jgi:hypothetical protein